MKTPAALFAVYVSPLLFSGCFLADADPVKKPTESCIHSIASDTGSGFRFNLESSSGSIAVSGSIAISAIRTYKRIGPDSFSYSDTGIRIASNFAGSEYASDTTEYREEAKVAIRVTDFNSITSLAQIASSGTTPVPLFIRGCAWNRDTTMTLADGRMAEYSVRGDTLSVDVTYGSLSIDHWWLEYASSSGLRRVGHSSTGRMAGGSSFRLTRIGSE